jgi:hypothetical protein
LKEESPTPRDKAKRKRKEETASSSARAPGMAGAIRALRAEGEEEVRSPRSPVAKRPAPANRERHGGGTGGGGGGGGSPRAAAAAGRPPPRPSPLRPAPVPPPALAAASSSAASFLKTFRADEGLVLYAPSPADALAEAASNKDSQVYFGERRRRSGGGFAARSPSRESFVPCSLSRSRTKD